ncbi:MAG: YbaK/EbsC family protein [Acidobacteria bacterium]|nr:YbaK/EbsC family protein [Acidobacteriota bacterium]
MSTVTETLEKRRVPFECLRHDRSFTTIEEARALGITADEVVKTIVLDTASGHALAVVPGSRRLDMKRMREAVGDARAHLASEDELRRDFPGYELGALPPLGSLLSAPVYVDPAVMGHDTVVFASGSQQESVRVRTADLFRDEPVKLAVLTRARGEEPEEAG